MTKFKEYMAESVLCESIVAEAATEELVQLIEGLTEIETQLNEFVGLKTASKWLKDRAEKKALDAQGKAYSKERATNEKQKAEKEALEAKQAAEKEAEDKKNATSVAKAEAKKTKTAERSEKIAKFSDEADKKVKEAKEAFTGALKGAKTAVADKIKDARVTTAVGTSLALKDAAEAKKAAGEKLKGITATAKASFTKFFKNLGELSEDQKKTLADLEGIYAKLSENKAVSGVEAIKIIATVLAGSTENGQVPSFKAYTKSLEKLRALPGLSSYKFSAKIA
jgi:chromosome segregation ATPase